MQVWALKVTTTGGDLGFLLLKEKAANLPMPHTSLGLGKAPLLTLRDTHKGDGRKRSTTDAGTY